MKRRLRVAESQRVGGHVSARGFDPLRLCDSETKSYVAAP